MPRLRALPRTLILALVAPAFSAAGAPPIFVDRTAESGLGFRHRNGMTGKLYFPEIMGAGGALFDYDGDGDLDLYLVQGERLVAGGPERDAPRWSDRLHRNNLTADPTGTPQARFVDVTAESRIRATGYGMGAATADYDGDGDVDLYVTNLGANQLWRNEGDGTFTDVTDAAGAGDRRWSVAATFFDFDRDGDLDLFVGNYVDWSVAGHRICLTPTAVETYCSPSLFEPTPDRLLRNRGDGTFEDVTTRTGLDRAFGPALGAVATDFDGDGWPDLYVANDGRPNQLWINHRGERFSDEALLAGCAVNEDGLAEGSMGVDAADFDGDGDDDLFMTHLADETHTLYRNDGRGLFEDVTVPADLGAPSLKLTGFGTAWLDVERDGDLDLLVANGAVKVIEAQHGAGDPHPYHQPNQLFLNRGDGRFYDATAASGEAFAISEVSRGAIFGDLDNDGDTDVVITNNEGPARVLMNETTAAGSWLGLRILEGPGGRDALGARAALLGTKATSWRRVRTDGSYASANDPRVLLAAPQPATAVRLRIQWPSHRAGEWHRLPLLRYATLGPPAPTRETSRLP